MCSKKIIVAIDGHSSCGKSTMAKWLARQVGYIYVDTGAMYRTVTLFAIRGGFITEEGVDEAGLEDGLKTVSVGFRLDQETRLPLACLNGEVVESDIRKMDVSSKVSRIAALPFVRRTLTAQQQRMGEDKGIVMDGRDIGTVVFPGAELKVFVTASAEVRARRRYDELVAKGEKDVTYDAILRNVEERDYADSHREISPLRKAEDALVLDNSDMTLDDQNRWLIDRFREAAGATADADCGSCE